MPSAGAVDVLFLPELREKADRGAAFDVHGVPIFALWLQHRFAHHLLLGHRLLAGDKVYAVCRSEGEADWRNCAGAPACFVGHNLLDRDGVDSKPGSVSREQRWQCRRFLKFFHSIILCGAAWGYRPNSHE